jgi:hypothetical protein
MLAPVMIVEQGRKIAPYEHPWSTIVSMASWLSLLGSLVIRSIAMWENGLALMVDGIRNIGVLMWCVRFLFCWHVAQPLMYSVIHVLAPGQKYSLLMHWMVSSHPRWPLMDLSCHTFISLCFSPWSGGMTRHHPLMSLQKGSSRLSTHSIGYVPSHSLIRAWLWFWIIVMVCSIEPLESGPANLMNAASGIMVICWLSSLTSSAPGGHDRVLAAVCSFLGTCWSLKL